MEPRTRAPYTAHHHHRIPARGCVVYVNILYERTKTEKTNEKRNSKWF